MRTGAANPLWLLGDQLGSTSVVANYDGTIFINGTTPARQGYKAWGEQRFPDPVSGSPLPTTFRYTGQREASFGLYFYGARWYDAYLNRWIQPDSILSLASQGTQAFDRYSFVNNNPLKFNDPTGHSVDCAVGEYGCEVGKLTPKGLVNLYNDFYHLDQEPRNWTPGQKFAFLCLVNEISEFNSQNAKKQQGAPPLASNSRNPNSYTSECVNDLRQLISEFSEYWLCVG
jgi:RHS repeat-associated protein